MESEMDAEMQFHVEARAEDLMRGGMARREALRRARVEFGGIEQAKEECREARGVSFIEGLLRDLRFSLRMLKNNPVSTAVAVLTLALGIGANTAIFSIVNAVMLSSLPVRDPNGLVVLQWSANSSHNGASSSYGDCLRNYGAGKKTGCSVSYPMFQQMREQSGIFSSVAAFAGPARVVVGGLGQAGVAQAELVSGDYFQILGVKTDAGRLIETADEKRGAEPVVVLNYGYWQGALGGSAGAIGRTIRLNNSPFRIIGIADAGFTRLTPGKAQDMWVPLTSGGKIGNVRAEDLDDPSSWWVSTVARVKDGVGIGQAQAAASVLFRNSVIHGTKPLLKEEDDPTIALLPAQRGLIGIRQTLATPLYILTAAVGMVLLISCANVAGLMLARARAREKEMAVRTALGASRGRIVRQVLTESVVLSAAGGVLGIFLAYWGADWLALFVISNSHSPMVLDVTVNAKVLTFTALTTVLTGTLFGLAPALWSQRVDAGPALKDNATNLSAAGHAGGRRFGAGSALVIGQVALSVVVLIGAGLLVRTLANLKNVNPGFETQNLLHFGMNPALSGYAPEKMQDLYDELQRGLAALPGVTSASYANGILLDGGLWSSDVHVEGMPKDATVETNMLAVGAAYFETMHIPLISGRGLGLADMRSKPDVAVVNESFVRKYLEGRNAIGMHLLSDENRTQREIVGVVGDAKYDQLRDNVAPTTYVPMRPGMVYFELRTGPIPAALIPAVRKLVGEVDENLPVFDLRTQTETIDRLLFNERLVARLSALFGLLALMLACVGLYGLLSYEVTRRTREIGIRTALGAQRNGVLRLVMKQGLLLAVAGATAGISAALWVMGYLGTLLYGVPAADPATFVAVAGLLLAVAFLACWVPARRATRVDPMVALRYE
jgi:predicted permease